MTAARIRAQFPTSDGFGYHLKGCCRHPFVWASYNISRYIGRHSSRECNARSESLTKGSLSDDSDSTLGSFRVRLDLGLRVSHHSQPRREASRPRSSKKERTIIFPLSGVPRGREKASGGHLSAAVPARRREKIKYDAYSNSNKKAFSRPRHVGKCSIIKGVFVRDSQ